jgi:thiol:disulfide interchange protein DsbD
MRIRFWMACLMLMFFSVQAIAQISPEDLLPVEEAFALQARAVPGAVELDFDIADGYYLYRHAFRFESLTDGVALGEPVIPPGEAGFDDFFGEIESYRERLRISLPIRSGGGGADIAVRFQGCADLGVCYPPHRQVFALTVEAAERAAPSGLDALLGRQSSSGAPLLESGGALPEEQAFVYEAVAVDPVTVLVRMTSAPQYYLYRHTIDFSVPGSEVRVGGIELPVAESIHDEFFGDTEVYYDQVEIPVRLQRPPGPARTVELTVDFQGCLTDGICYPPMTRTLAVDLPPATPEQVVVELLPSTEPGSATTPPGVAEGEQDRLARLLGGSPVLALAFFLLAGVLLAFTPCVFPMIPILSGLIAGEGERMTTARAFRLSLVYVLAMALVYTGFGVVAGLFGQNLQAIFQQPLVLYAFAGLFVLLSLSMFGFYELQLPSALQTRLNALSNRAEGGTLIGAAIMGGLSALVVGPCVAPALMGALIYIGQTGDAVLGGAALFSMALGMGIPLMIWGTSAGKLLPRAGAWMVAIKAVFGVGLLALAIWMLERALPGAVIMILWGGLAIACGVYLFHAGVPGQGPTGWQKLWRSVGVMLIVLGALQFAGALSGGQDWLRPLHHLAGSQGGAGARVAAPEFERIDTLEQLEARIAASTAPVFLDFYADWCVDCVRMERRTFPDPGVAERMSRFTLLKVDVTDYTEAHRAILSSFGLIGPPAYLFFDNGMERSELRTFGFKAPAEFNALLDEVLR